MGAGRGPGRAPRGQRRSARRNEDLSNSRRGVAHGLRKAAASLAVLSSGSRRSLMFRKLSFAPLLGSLSMLVACSGVSVGTGAASSGCGPGGANENQHVVGDQPGGVKLGLGEIAVAPDGSYVIFEGEGRLSVGWPATGLVEDLPVARASKLAFSKKRDVVYVSSDEDLELHAVDVRAKKELWA